MEQRFSSHPPGRSSRRFFLIVGCLLCLGLMGCVQFSSPDAATLSPPSWAHETSDLKPDPRVVWGRLPNGLRYAILPHATPSARASLLLLVQAGSYHERDAERGYAHYVEHMAFRDTRDFPGDSAIKTLQRLGVSFGPHANATTSLFQTDYNFNDMPTDDPAALATGLKILRAIADGVIFDDLSVERERGVIFSEKRSHDGRMANAWSDELDFLPPGNAEPRFVELASIFHATRLADRHPMGEEKILARATARKLRAFYDRWYRPERMILTIAGDVSPSDVEQLVRGSFSTMVGRGRKPSEPIIEGPKLMDGTWIPISAELSQVEPAINLSLGALHRQLGPDNIERRRRRLTRSLALKMLERRLDHAAESPDAPFVSGEAKLSHFVPGRDVAFLRARSRPTVWPKAMIAIDQEARRAGELGFAAPEFEQALRKARVLSASQARYAAHQSSAELARALAFSIARGVVFTSPEDELRLAAEHFDSLTAAQCQAELRDLLPSRKLAIALSGPFDTDGVPHPNEAVAAINESVSAELTPYGSLAPPKPFPYTDFGPPGQIAKRDYHTDLDAELIQFANGVRLNLKRTAFEPGRVRLSLRFGGGRLACPVDQPGLDLRVFAWVLGGLRDLPPDELRAALVDLSGNFTLNSTSDAFEITSETESSTLPLLLQAMTAYFAYPVFRDEAWAAGWELTRQQIVSQESTASGLAQVALARRMAGNHPALGLPTIAEASQRTFEELKAWLSPLLATAPMEITLIGDFETNDAIDAASNTFGALPARVAEDPYEQQRQVSFPPRPFSETLSFRGLEGLAVVSLAWFAPEATSFPERLRGQILAAILRDRLRLKLRAEMGETYSPQVAFEWTDHFSPSPTYLRCSIEAAPERVDRVAASVREIAATLASGGITPEEFERARHPLVRETESGLRNNEWWLGALDFAQFRPAHAKGWASALSEYRAATWAEVDALARQLLVEERRCQLIVTPQPPETDARHASARSSQTND